jgi:hypothetical protein
MAYANLPVVFNKNIAGSDRFCGFMQIQQLQLSFRGKKTARFPDAGFEKSCHSRKNQKMNRLIFTRNPLFPSFFDLLTVILESRAFVSDIICSPFFRGQIKPKKCRLGFFSGSSN